jgi:hypothetical protein
MVGWKPGSPSQQQEAYQTSDTKRRARTTIVMHKCSALGIWMPLEGFFQRKNGFVTNCCSCLLKKWWGFFVFLLRGVRRASVFFGGSYLLSLKKPANFNFSLSVPQETPLVLFEGFLGFCFEFAWFLLICY